MHAARELVESCQTLLSLPEIYLRIRKVVEDRHSSMDDLAKALALDPSMTARVLQIVNSPFYSVPRRIDTLSQAVNLLGMRPIQNIVFATSVGKAFPKLPPTVMDMNAYWTASVLCALLSIQFARLSRIRDSEPFFIAGLLRDIGHLVLYQTAPDRAQSALVEAQNLNQPLAEVERASIGCDYAEVGAELINKWGMPPQLEQVIRYQLSPDQASSEAQRGAAILFAAGTLVDFLGRHGLRKAIPAEIFAAALGPLQISQPSAEDALSNALDQLNGTLALIYPAGRSLAA
ncbi:HDOD domain-containing protein [Nitrospira moscoviensis]|uniref:HDOD domain-containing protein n=1 Tax=Nitrospira moscoviensis TaxID=42253 RepID=A0A0K2GHX9_NITMO|nr:HDOD domain-containing protein [Nitrospira moscoviensis]ALA60454.1 hypothetical protein NITMOv2_4070 [Nitrospira moscoviensis]